MNFMIIVIYLAFFPIVVICGNMFVDQTNGHDSNDCSNPNDPCRTLSHACSILSGEENVTIVVIEKYLLTEDVVANNHPFVLTLEGRTSDENSLAELEIKNGSIFLNISEGSIIRNFNILDENSSGPSPFLFHLSNGVIEDSTLRISSVSVPYRNWVYVNEMRNVELRLSKFVDGMFAVEKFTNCDFHEDVENPGSIQVFDLPEYADLMIFQGGTFSKFMVVLRSVSVIFEDVTFTDYSEHLVLDLETSNSNFSRCIFKNNIYPYGMTLIGISGFARTIFTNGCEFTNNSVTTFVNLNNGVDATFEEGTIFHDNIIRHVVFEIGASVNFTFDSSEMYDNQVEGLLPGSLFSVFSVGYLSLVPPKNVHISNSQFRNADIITPFIRCSCLKKCSSSNNVLDVEFDDDNVIEPYINPITCQNCSINGNTCEYFSDEYGKKQPVPPPDNNSSSVPWYTWGIPIIAVFCACLFCSVFSVLCFFVILPLCCIVFVGGGTIVERLLKTSLDISRRESYELIGGKEEEEEE